MLNILAIAIGGALGAVLRYWTGLIVSRFYHKQFPLDILIVNVTGSFLIGFFAGMGGQGLSELARQFLMTGVCGALTTFSTFSFNTFRLISDGLKMHALANIVLSVALCLPATAFGLFLAR